MISPAPVTSAVHTIGSALASAADRLRSRSSSPNLDAQVLLAAILDHGRTWLLAHPEAELSEEAARTFEVWVGKVQAGAAVPHLVGRWEFYGRTFRLSPDVLIPRPETELVVEASLRLANGMGPEPLILDVGTGSGCIGVSLALELPGARVVASDLSGPALAVARINIREYGLAERVRLVRADVMGSLRGPFDLICANLPYVRTADLASVRRAEPRLALDGGADGLRLVRRLVAELSGRIHPGGAAVLEIDPRQAAAVRHLATRHLPGSRVEVLADLAGRARVVAIQVAEPDGG